jgi:co-chaperonin GroES (HSP10)
MALSSPTNNIIVTIDTRYIADLYNMIRLAALNPGSQINPADYVQIIGKVVSVPKSICGRQDYKGYSAYNIKEGDMAIFSYKVVFTFDEDGDGGAAHRNAFMHKGKEYWKVDVQELFGVIRDGQIIMQNGYCMVQDMTAPPVLIMPVHTKRMPNCCSATLTHVGENLTTAPRIHAKSGDTVYYNPAKLQPYKINGKPFGILRQKDILAFSVAKYDATMLIN